MQEMLTSSAFLRKVEAAYRPKESAPALTNSWWPTIHELRLVLFGLSLRGQAIRLY